MQIKSIIVGLVLIGVGLGELLSWDVIWPVVLIAGGVFILFRALILRR